MNCALILSGGKGERFGAPRPKQYTKILGKYIIEYVLEAAFSAGSIDKVLVAGYDSDEMEELTAKYGFMRVPGGEKRNITLKNGLDALKAAGCDNVIILDAVRPLVTAELIDEYMRLLAEGWDAVSTTHPIDDSLGCLDFQKVDRSRYYLMQSPEAYRFEGLYAAFDPDSPLTEVAQQLDADARVYLYKKFMDNPKLTYPRDLVYIELALKEKYDTTGTRG